MRNIKIILALSVVVLTCGKTLAQQDPMVSEYMFNQLYLNPAYAGCHPYTNATLLLRKQWVNFSGSPTTEIFSMDGSINNKNMGLGLTLLNDHIGVSNRSGFYGSYSYRLKLNQKQFLSMGLDGGASYYQAQLTDLVVWDQGDNVFTSNINSKLIPNFGGGLYYYANNYKYYAGLSVPNILSYKPNTFLYVDLNAPQFQRHYYLTGGYTFSSGKEVAWKPSVLLKYTKGAPTEADFNLNVLLDSVISIGASYRTGDSFLGMVEFYIIKNLRIGYAYDYPFTEMRKYSAGSHEIRLSYDLGKDAAKSSKPMFYCY